MRFFRTPTTFLSSLVLGTILFAQGQPGTKIESNQLQTTLFTNQITINETELIVPANPPAVFQFPLPPGGCYYLQVFRNGLIQSTTAQDYNISNNIINFAPGIISAGEVIKRVCFSH